MDKTYAEKRSCLCGAVSYFTWAGFAAALFFSDRDDHFVRLHLNQALVLNTFFTLVCIAAGLSSVFLPYILAETVKIAAGVVGVILAIGWFIGWISAAKGYVYEAPLFGNLHWI